MTTQTPNDTTTCATCGKLVRVEAAMSRDGLYWHQSCSAPAATQKPSLTAAEYAAAVAALKSAVQVSFTEMSRLRHETAVAKVPLVIDHIQSFVDAGVKVVVFGHHHDVLDPIAAAFPGISVVVDGRVPVPKRQANVDRFQNDPDCLVFIGEFQAAGTGWTLTAASNVVFAEFDWVPGNMSQCEDRCNRIGQKNAVLAQYLALEGSLDAVMAHKLVSKESVIFDALDRKPEPAQPIIVPAAPTTAPSTGSVNQNPPSKPVVNDPVQIAAIHEALRLVAGVCDGAHMQDNVGFNGTDTDFGRQLAAQDSISPRQAFVAAKMLLKYHKQVGAERIQVCKEAIADATGQARPAAPAPKPAKAAKPAPAAPTQQSQAAPQQQPAAPKGNPYKAGTQTAKAFDILSDGQFHTWEELKTANPKWPKDSVIAIAKDAASMGWTINRTKEGFQLTLGA